MKLFGNEKMTLRSKVNLLVLLDVLLVVTLTTAVFSYIFIRTQFYERGERALAVAKIVANMPQIIQGFKEPDPSAVIQPLAESIRKETGAAFVVVGNMNLIRYSHPNPWQIGKTMVGGDDYQVLHGHDSISQAVGTLGPSIRGKAPIFNADHQQIGVVSVGYMVEGIWDRLTYYLIILIVLSIVGIAIGFTWAYFLSGHIKKQIYNLEPADIALLVQEQAAILESIREGVLAANSDGKIVACNQEAKRLLELGADNVIGQPINVVVPSSGLLEVMAQGTSYLDQPMIIGNTLVVTNNVPIMLNGRIIGSVATFRDKMHLDEIDQSLARIGQYADALRSQQHEFMNRLHTISGLLSIEEYDLARKLIDQVNEEQQRVLEFFAAKIRDPAVIGILVGKMYRANELGIHLIIDPGSRLLNSCRHQDLVVTILGNAIENSFEALMSSSKRKDGKVTVYISDENPRLIVRISDSGPGIAPELKDHIFEDGVTTKGNGRGFGLSLIFRRVSRIGATLTVMSSDEGTVLEARLPN